MIRNFFSPGRKLFFEQGISLVRIITGLFMIYHGWEIFDAKKMQDYGKWLSELHLPYPYLAVWLGKGSELISGFFLVAGLFTRLAVWPMILTMLIICFGMGHGNIFYDDQHPFLFVLLGLVLFLYGPGKFSADQYFFGNANKRTYE